MTGPCPYNCKMKSTTGYCQNTACTNPKYNGTGTWHVTTCQYCFKTVMSQDELPDTCPNCGRKLLLPNGKIPNR